MQRRSGAASAPLLPAGAPHGPDARRLRPAAHHGRLPGQRLALHGPLPTGRAGVNHGGVGEPSSLSGTALMTPAMWQLSLDSRFLQALNGDEAPGPVDYTAIYSRYDVLDVCPGMLTDHFTDASAHSLIVDALLHHGPASAPRSGAREACTASPLNPSGLAAIDRLARELPGILEDSIANGPPELPLVSEEPPLKPYAE